jgi:uncharacterized membrane protein
MNRNREASRKIALGAVAAAAVTVATMIHMPVPGFRVYFNLGEGVIYVIALTLGARYGAVSASLGAALADLLLGYPLWAPLTFCIKGVEGFVVGRLAPKGTALALAAGATVMIAGYTSAAGLLYGWKAAPVELVTDLVQTGMGAAFALLFVPIVRRRLALSEMK